MERTKVLGMVETYPHFSHQHPLVQSNGTPSEDTDCSGCGLNIVFGKKHYYKCKTCPFFLHHVCYNLPKKTRHTSHPAHPLTLLAMPLSAEGVLKCSACGDQVTGFYYTCTDCSICYHILCIALPFSVESTSHPHPLKLEFSPPPDIFCDVCKEVSYNEWLYRCRICDYDTHLGCAMGNLKVESRLGLGYVTDNNEVTELIVQSRRGNNISNAIAGWDERLNSPKTCIGGRDHFGNRRKLRIGWLSPNLRRRQAEENSESGMSTLLPSPGDHSALPTPSSLFSDGCFSIDLQLSLSSFDPKNQGSEEAKGLNMHAIPEGNKQSPDDTNKIMLEKFTNNLKMAEHKPNIGGAVQRDNNVTRSGRSSSLGKLFSCCS